MPEAITIHLKIREEMLQTIQKVNANLEKMNTIQEEHNRLLQENNSLLLKAVRHSFQAV